VGAIGGTIVSKSPRLFTLLAGVQWFTGGTTFWTVRSALLDDGLKNWWLRSRGQPLEPISTPTSSEKIRASAIASGCTGGILAMFRGPQNVIPGIIVFSVFGFTGQHTYEWFDQRHTRKLQKQLAEARGEVENLNWLQRFAKKSWTPFSILTDDKYEDLLNEKLLKIEVEIALIDDKLKELRNVPRETKVESPGNVQNQERK
jgi:hypothetical protein